MVLPILALFAIGNLLGPVGIALVVLVLLAGN
jgi:hypothetical protein